MQNATDSIFADAFIRTRTTARDSSWRLCKRSKAARKNKAYFTKDRDRLSLSVFGGLSIFLIYGGILNPTSVLMYQSTPTLKMILTTYVTGLAADAVHAAATVFFLWFLSESMLEKLDRVKVKYGLIE